MRDVVENRFTLVIRSRAVGRSMVAHRVCPSALSDVVPRAPGCNGGSALTYPSPANPVPITTARITTPIPTIAEPATMLGRAPNAATHICLPHNSFGRQTQKVCSPT